MLDEGMDIQKLKNAIILSSDGNPKQYIQRRGRVLRTWSGTYADGTKKEFAEIFDIIVFFTEIIGYFYNFHIWNIFSLIFPSFF